MLKSEANTDVPRIAALQGAPRETIQAVLAEFVAQARREGRKLAGVVETTCASAEGACGTMALEDLATGEIFSISQDLGPGSVACNLDAAGLAAACAAVERAIRSGADLVVISKFGKQEAARSGLYEGFLAAVHSGLPIATSVSPALTEPWREFAGSLFVILPATIEALDSWHVRVGPKSFAHAAE